MTNDVKSSIEQLRAVVPQLNQLTAKLKEALADVRERKANAEADRDALLQVPMRKEDYLAMLHADIDARANVALESAVRKINSDVRELAPGDRATYGYRGIFGSMKDIPLGKIYLAKDVLFPVVIDTFSAECFKHREPFKAAISEAVAHVEWPYGESAMSMKRLRSEHEKVTTSIAALIAEEDEILQQAAQLGIAVE